MPWTDRQATERVAQLEASLERLESMPDESSRNAALNAVQTLVDLYGEALARVVDHVGTLPEASARVASLFADDELISHLLMVHGLHPEALEVRVERALEEVRPYLKSHGGDVELVSIENGVARLRLDGSCHGCPSSALTMRSTVEDAIRRIAPELEIIETADETVASPELVPLTVASRGAFDGGAAADRAMEAM